MKLFGTDGVRGAANSFPVKVDVVVKLGQALGVFLKKNPHKKGKNHLALIGKDTRISGYMIEQALASGLNSVGVHVQLVGPMPTPGVGFLAQSMRADAGVVISASHNPYSDNGIKLFYSNGFKFSFEDEAELEKLCDEDLDPHLTSAKTIGRTRRIDDATGRYMVFVKNAFPHPLSLEGLKIVVDCANGSAYKILPAIFEELGAHVVTLSHQPTGFNINKNCGALHPQTLQKTVLETGASLGVGVDGDADRLVMVDEKGQLFKGDHIIALCALHLKKENKLNNNTVVLTPMSSLALAQTFEKEGIRVVYSDVGDKSVVQLMKENNSILGGEPSGHIVFLNFSKTGDACVGALKALSVMIQNNCKLSELRGLFPEWPQVLKNIRVRSSEVHHSVNGRGVEPKSSNGSKISLKNIEGYKNLLKSVEKELGDKGRIFVRSSGTEPVIRVFVEGQNDSQITQLADRVCNFLVDKTGGVIS